MKQSRTLITSIYALIILAAGCVAEPGLDKGKFAELNQAAGELKTAIQSGQRCGFPESLVERLASGTAALKDKTSTKAERDLLSAYAHLLATCKDGLLLCQTRTLLTDFPFVPKGRIYVTQYLDPIIDKYDLPVEKHVYKPTGKYWKSIPDDSIGVVWKSAETEIRNIENMMNYN